MIEIMHASESYEQEQEPIVFEVRLHDLPRARLILSTSSKKKLSALTILKQFVQNYVDLNAVELI